MAPLAAGSRIITPTGAKATVTLHSTDTGMVAFERDSGSLGLALRADVWPIR